MPGRDVEIRLIGRDDTGRATRSAGNNLDQLARKIDKFNSKAITGGKTKIDNSTIVADTKRTFGRAGERGAAEFNRRFRAKMSGFSKQGQRVGAAFMAGLIKTITFGQLGQGFAHAAIRAAPAAAKAGGLLGAAMAGALIVQLGTAITAAVPLLLGGLLVAGPIAFLLKQGAKASKDATQQQKAIAALQKRIASTKDKGRRADLQKELQLQQKNLDQLHKQAQQFDRLKLKAKSFMETISRPLRVPLAQSITEIGKGFDRLKGPLVSLFKQIGPALAPLTKGVMGLFVEFIKAVKKDAPSIAASFRAWGKALPGVGKALGAFFGKIIKDPQKTVDAVKNLASTLKQFAADSGTIVSGLQEISQGYGDLAKTINKFENNGGKDAFLSSKSSEAQTQAFRAPWKRTWRAMVDDANTAVIGILAAMDKLFQGIPSIPGSPFDKLKTGVHNALISARDEFDKTKEKRRQLDAALAKKTAVTKITADIRDLSAKLKTARAKLKDPTLTKKQRAKVGADIKELTAKLKAAKQKLDAVKHGKTIAKLHADAKDLQAKIKRSRAQLRTVHNSKPRAKIKGDIRDAQAKLRQIRSQLAALNGKTATVYVKTIRRNIVRHIDINVPGSFAGDAAWSGSLSGGGTSRTGGPAPVNVAAPIVDTRVFLDSREIRSVARSTVLDENRRNAYRARVGRR